MAIARRIAVTVLVLGLSACGGGGGGGSGNGGGGSTPPPPGPPEPPPPVGAWSPAADMPHARSEISVAALDGRLYVAGGGAADTADAKEFLIYDGTTDSWSRGAEVPATVHHAALVAHDDRLFLIGGYHGTQGFATVSSTLYIYDVGADTWSTGSPMPTARGAHAAAVIDGNIHVVGGSTDGGQSSIATHEIYDIVAGTWTTSTPMQVARDHLAAAAQGGHLYAAAGRVGGASSAMRAFERYDPVTQQWTTLAQVPTGRSGVAMVAFQGELYLFGGETFAPEPNRTYAEAERYDPATDTWESIAPMPTARHGLGAGVLGNAIHVVGGGPGVGWTFSRINERWEP